MSEINPDHGWQAVEKHLETAEKTGALNLSGARPCPRPTPAAAAPSVA